MAVSLTLLPGSAIRWCERRYVVVDYVGLDAIIAREPGQRRLERIPVNEAKPAHAASTGWTPPDLVSVPEEQWREAVQKFELLKPLLEMEEAERTLADVKKTADALGRHPVTVYRWIQNYKRTGRLSVFLRKQRSDRGTSRLLSKVDKIIETAIKKIYLTAESPDIAAVIEEVNLQCFKRKIDEKPHANTVRARIARLSDRLKLEKRKGTKAAAERYEPIKGSLPRRGFSSRRRADRPYSHGCNRGR